MFILYYGRYGFRGNLTAGDIVNQVLAIPQADKVTHVVFIGHSG